MLHTILSNPESVATTLMLIFWSLVVVCVGFSPLDPPYTRQQQYKGLSEDNKAKWKSTHDPVE